MPKMILEFPLNGIQLDLGTTATFDDISGYLSTERLEGDFPIDRITGDVPVERISGNLPLSHTEGDLPVSRINGNFPLSQTDGSLPVNRLEDISGVMSEQDAHNIWNNIRRNT